MCTLIYLGTTKNNFRAFSNFFGFPHRAADLVNKRHSAVLLYRRVVFVGGWLGGEGTSNGCRNREKNA